MDRSHFRRKFGDNTYLCYEATKDEVTGDPEQCCLWIQVFTGREVKTWQNVKWLKASGIDPATIGDDVECYYTILERGEYISTTLNIVEDLLAEWVDEDED